MGQLKIAFRVDASVEIGSGHVMRCLALADALQRKGHKVFFICRELHGDLKGVIKNNDFSVYCLAVDRSGQIQLKDHLKCLRSQWREDAENTARILKEAGDVDWLVVDHYAFDANWEEMVYPHTKHLMVIDDMADRQHNCDLLLNQNYYSEIDHRYDSLLPEKCRLLLGPRYALLRTEFKLKRKLLRERAGNVRRILLFFGGADPFNETGKALSVIGKLNVQGLAVDVVVGESNPHGDEIKQLCSQMEEVTFHHQVNTMGELMSCADLAIGAGGSATWERCCMGLPSIVITIAENQEQLAMMMAENGYLLYLGKSQKVTEGNIHAALDCAIHNPYLLRNMSKNSMRLIDGRGTDRVAEILCGLDISIRRATLEDCKKIFSWRNDYTTRKFFFDSEPLIYEKHVEWCTSVLSASDRVLLIGRVEDEDIGVIRYDFYNEKANISVYLAPDKKGLGYGSKLIAAGSRWLHAEVPEIMFVEAEIMEENHASINAFAEAGYALYRRKMRYIRSIA